MTGNASGGPEPTWTLGPISIKRTTDVLALVAFFLSVIGLLGQGRDYFRGAHAVLFTPEQITFGSTKAFKTFFQRDDKFVLLSAVMGYVNDAPAGFNAAVGREYLRFYAGGKKYQYLAHQTVSTSAESSVLTAIKKEDAGPFAVNAGSAVSREILFLPHKVKCTAGDEDCVGSLPGLKWEDFIQVIRKDPKISVLLLADVYGKTTLSTRCSIMLNPNDIAALGTENQEWAAPECTEEKEQGFWTRFF